MVSDNAQFFTARSASLAKDATAFRWKFEASHVDPAVLNSDIHSPIEGSLTWDVATERAGPVFYEYDFSDGKDSFELLVQVVYPDGRTAHERFTVTENGFNTTQ